MVKVLVAPEQHKDVGQPLLTNHGDETLVHSGWHLGDCEVADGSARGQSTVPTGKRPELIFFTPSAVIFRICAQQHRRRQPGQVLRCRPMVLAILPVGGFFRAGRGASDRIDLFTDFRNLPPDWLVLVVEGVGEQVPEFGSEIGSATLGLGAGRAEIDEPVLEDRPRHRLQRLIHPSVQLNLVLKRIEYGCHPLLLLQWWTQELMGENLLRGCVFDCGACIAGEYFVSVVWRAEKPV